MPDYSIRDSKGLSPQEIQARRVDRARAFLLDVLQFCAGGLIVGMLLWAVSRS